MQTDPSESELPTLEKVLDRKEVEVGGEQYTIYYEPKIARNAMDRCFGYTTKDNPEPMNLFQIADVDLRNSGIKIIDMGNQEVYSKLIQLGKTLKQEETISTDGFPVSKGKIVIGQKEFLVTYQSHNVAVADDSLHYYYAKKVLARQYH